MDELPQGRLRKPEWLKIRLQRGQGADTVNALIAKYGLNTICEEASCPNRQECWSRRTAAFLILGPNCTRNCGFCGVTREAPSPLDPEEPFRLAKAVKELSLAYIVVTSVTRDDLPDGGAAQFASVISSLKREIPSISVEVLVPDFKGDMESLRTVIAAGPAVLNHNIETVPRLYATVRPQACYALSLKLLESAKGMSAGKIKTKSGLMVGLGETEEEVGEALRDLRAAGCDIVTIGQYLAPSPRHLPVVEYLRPEAFDRYRSLAYRLGFEAAASGPFVRSSYFAERLLAGGAP